MSELHGNGVDYFYALWQRFRNMIIQDVPEDYQMCEFECHNAECITGDWEKCERRLCSNAPTQDQP
jgi:hypothetical protein